MDKVGTKKERMQESRTGRADKKEGEKALEWRKKRGKGGSDEGKKKPTLSIQLAVSAGSPISVNRLVFQMLLVSVLLSVLLSIWLSVLLSVWLSVLLGAASLNSSSLQTL